MLRRLAPVALLALAGCATAPETPVAPPPQPLEVQILAINDFHGNIVTPQSPVTVRMADSSERTERLGGAAALAATLDRLRVGEPHSVTVSAGDLTSASPLVSAYFLDEPTIAAMNAMDLDLNAVGNHEFDRGSAELLRMQSGGCEKYTTRVPCRVEPFAGADFGYLAANVRRADGATLFPATALRQFGPITIGFIGMTLEDTATLVSPAGVAGLSFADEAATANALVPGLKAAGADAIVLLIHEGGETPVPFHEAGCDSIAGPILGIMDRLDTAITTVVSGHTHNAYACTLRRGGAERLLTSAGRYGTLVTDIRLRFDPASEALIGAAAANVPVVPGAGADPEVAAIVERYAKAAAPAAARVVGQLRGAAPFSEAKGESPAANLIADAQLAATSAADRGDADLSFINGGGVRTSLAPAADGSVTYGQVFAMQPFGNNLVVKSMTGTQLKALLEQQFVTADGTGAVRMLLIPSANFRFAYDLSRPQGQRIVEMRLDGQPVDPARTYRVTVNNFLSSGGDGFTLLANIPTVHDAGLDLDALEAWLATSPAAPAVGRTRNVTSR